jgi:ABC-type branched-subunit amino acid transport system substrate-binding protein
LALLSTACGARLTIAQKQAGIDTLGGGGSAAGPGTSDGPAGGPSAGPTAGGPGGPIAGPNGPSGPNPATSVPPGGNGGATDTGVTPTTITITTASDISGVQAGLFKSTHQAMQALTTMVNYEGGLYGRQIKWIPADSKADTVANQAAVKDACTSSFALVGSMSAFDNGGASTGEQCGIPDLSAIAVNPSRQTAKNVYPMYPLSPDRFAIGTANYIKNTYGNDVIKHAAMLYLNAGVTKVNALQRMKAYETVGFDWIYKQEVQVLEANYSPFVQKMKEKGIKYVNMVANYQSIQKLLNAMEQNEYYPQVRDWDSVAYSQSFTSVGKPADGSIVFVTTAMYEELSSNPEMQLYVKWLSRVAPGAKPDYFGFYAWSAGRLFVKVHQMVGAKITRKKFIDALRTIHSWDGNGIHVANDVGAKIQSPCILYMEIRQSRFVRKAPANGFMCNQGGIIRT